MDSCPHSAMPYTVTGRLTLSTSRQLVLKWSAVLPSGLQSRAPPCPVPRLQLLLEELPCTVFFSSALNTVDQTRGGHLPQEESKARTRQGCSAWRGEAGHCNAPFGKSPLDEKWNVSSEWVTAESVSENEEGDRRPAGTKARML